MRSLLPPSQHLTTTTIARPFTTAAPTTAVSTLSPNREPRYSCPNNLGDDKCAPYEQYCNSALYRKTLTQSCAKTCGFCLDVCHDTLDYCPRMKPYCNSKDYEAYKTHVR
ncbi:hypothetical protein L596_021816 [Steinernema carpocapsae]|uniref:ShKT domain-containing protein n=1 Tax=Steinernema carpocapsae TaxID=34508 RepID=A0A4U5MJY8_STECR|nr:hypothetical protein L596_021816 [Steinernema carpocapsae]